jgi:hypothetical protein
MKPLLATLLVLGVTTLAIAQEATTHENIAAAAPEHTATAQPQSQPVLPADGSWAGPLVIFGIIGLFFFPAAVIGPIVRMLTPEEVPPAHSHDEPPGTSGHHGKTGIVDTDDHGHGHSHGH